jgi:hypothetical protein
VQLVQWRTSGAAVAPLARRLLVRRPAMTQPMTTQAEAGRPSLQAHPALVVALALAPRPAVEYKHLKERNK